MLIYNVSQCTIIEIHQMIHIIGGSNTREETRRSARKACLLIDLYLLYELTLAETDCFCKDTLITAYQRTRSMSLGSETLGVAYGDRGLRKAAATLWNNLPLTIKTCKTLNSVEKMGKTILFISPYLI